MHGVDMLETLEPRMYIVLLVNNIITTSIKIALNYKGAIIWDNLPANVKQCVTLLEFKRALNHVYHEYNDVMS